MDRKRNRQKGTVEGGERESERKGEEGNGGERTLHSLRIVVRCLEGMTGQITTSG